MNHLIANIAGKTRREKLHGREHIVAPLSMIVPGVLNGSNGPILYTAEENRKSVDSWNGMPITVYHPKKPVSARSPEILNSQGVGVVLKSRIDNGVLKAEGWFDIETTSRIDKRVLDLLLNGDKIELSTGLGMDEELAEEGATTNNGQSYQSIARNYRPDHLAVLPDQIGACSVKAGCGVCNKQEESGKEETSFHLTSNEVSHEEINGALHGQLKSKFKQDEPSAWITDVFDNHIVYRQGEDLFKLGYSKSGESVTLSDEAPVKVQRKTSFVTVSNSKEEEKVKPTFNKETVVTALITNCECWTEADKETLNSMSENQLTRIATNAAQQMAEKKLLATIKDGSTIEVDGKKLAFNSESSQFEEVQNTKEEEGKKDEEKTMNNAGQGLADQPQTAEQWFAAAPPEVQNTLKFAQQIQQKHKADLVSKIVDNADATQRDSLTPVYNAMSVEQLEVIANSLPKKTEAPRQTYLGAAPAPIQNAQQKSVSEPLAIPTIDWGVSK
jgi:hypothetical protein